MNISAEQLYRIRRTHGLSMRQMAKVLDCTSGYINGLEKEKFPMTYAIREKIIEKFDMSPNKMRSITLWHETHMKQFEGIVE